MSAADRELLERLLAKVDNRFYGKYLGFVVDNVDPAKRGRLRAKVPEVFGPDVVSGWAEPCFPYGGGADFGTFSIPPVTKSGDEYTTGVWIEFRGGNPQFPIWVGTFFGAPGNKPEAPGDDSEPNVNVHVARTFAGHSITAVDSAESERLEIRDAAGQLLSFTAALKPNTKRDPEGKKVTETVDVAYSDLVANEAKITLTDFAGNTLLLDASKASPTVRITNADRDGNVMQTIEMIGSSSSPQIVITDNNENVITLSKDGIKIEALSQTGAIKLDSAGITADAPKIDLNQGSQGAARKNDKVESGMADDPSFWTWVTTLMTWVQTHTHVAPLGPTSPPVPPFPGSTPSKCTGKIIESSGSVTIGD